MTLRSPKQQHKSTTFSRRLRNRNDQHLSAQPPESLHLRSQRSRRATTLSSARHISVNYPTEEAQSSVTVWDPTEDINHFTRSNTSLPSGVGLNQPAGLLLSQPLSLSPLDSPHQSPTGLLTNSTQPDTDHFETQPTTTSELLPSPLPSLSGSHTAVDFDFGLSPEPQLPQRTSVELQDMSTLDFMMPAHYGGHYGLPPLHSPSYPELNHHSYAEARTSQPSTSAPEAYVPPYTSNPGVQNDQLNQDSYSDSRSQPPTSEPYMAATSDAYVPSYASNSGVQDDPRRSAELLPSFRPSPDARSPYQQSLDPIRVSTIPSQLSPIHPVPVSHGYTYPPMNSITSSNVNGSHYPPGSIYPPSYHVHPSYASSSPPYSGSLAAPIPGAPLPASPSAQGQGNAVRVLSPQRQKPQCWDHGCNGRAFSTFSNLLRHQREKSGTAAKAYCPRCGAEFTRTTARNGHMAHEKCKPRRPSDSSSNK